MKQLTATTCPTFMNIHVCSVRSRWPDGPNFHVAATAFRTLSWPCSRLEPNQIGAAPACRRRRRRLLLQSAGISLRRAAAECRAWDRSVLAPGTGEEQRRRPEWGKEPRTSETRPTSILPRDGDAGERKRWQAPLTKLRSVGLRWGGAQLILPKNRGFN
ncbi:hypothetical protein VPH35_062816 [Triticum aestivum]